MIPNIDLWRWRKSGEVLKEPIYKLDQFSLPDYQDPVVPVQIMMVMMGFTILLLNSALIPGKDKVLAMSAVLSGVAYLISFMFYLTEYYEKLWQPFFLLLKINYFFDFTAFWSVLWLLR